jgi:hypothetical protein
MITSLREDSGDNPRAILSAGVASQRYCQRSDRRESWSATSGPHRMHEPFMSLALEDLP